jgi:hypothetical protein
MRAVILVLVLAAGCTDDFTRGPDGGSPPVGDNGMFPDLVGPMPDGVKPYTGEPVVYAHTETELYKVDPTKLQVTLVGAFKWPGAADQMTDIALDRDGKMTGISFDTVYSVDTKTAACTFLATLQTPLGVGSFTGLSYIAVAQADVTEALMAAAGDGSLYEINPKTGQSKSVGNYGGGLGSSGDLVSVQGATYATVKKTLSVNDWLASVNTLTGQATLIGDTGFQNVWGLGYWKDKVYGFTEDQKFITIDPKTGKGTQVGTSSAHWWGAGVTTAAPVIE